MSHFGQWGLVLIVLTIFGWFILKYLKPRRKIEWRNNGILGAFLIALYVEMYGFPLTIYILSSVFRIKLPFEHVSGHLWASLFGFGEAGAMIEMMVAYLIIAIGGFLIVAGWEKIYKARDKNKLVVDGIYKYIRHPQYAGIILASIGMIIHWPTIITILMWPILILAYYSLAKREERELEKEFGRTYQEYKNKVPMFLPRFK